MADESPKNLHGEFNGFGRVEGEKRVIYHINVVNPDQKRVETVCNPWGELAGHIETEAPTLRELDRKQQKKLCPQCRDLSPPFGVIEYSTHFEVVHTRTGRRHHMGDGVDTLFSDEDIFEAISPGSPGFREKWEASLNESSHSISETYEAYFPDLDPDDYGD